MHPLQRRIELLRSRLRWWSAVRGLSLVVATVVGMIVLWGLGDYVLRFQDRGLRVLAWLATVGLLGGTFYRWLYRPMAPPLGDVDLARRVQEQFPVFGDRLQSAVEFLRQREEDPLAGSAALRRAVISQTTAAAEGLDFTDVLDRRPPLRASLAMVGVLLAAGLLTLIDPAAAQIALARLANPLSDVAWPQRTHLALAEPVERVARGQPLEIEVVDAEAAPLPAEIRVHYRFEAADGTTTTETERLPAAGNRLLVRRESVSRPLEFRIEGGDDRSMPWQRVEVVEPPAIASLAIELLPPAYTGWPASRPTGTILRALAGTRARLTAESTKPLRSASLCLDGGREIPARLSDDGMRLSVGGPAKDDPAGELVIERSGAYWFKLLDRDGLTGGQESRSEIRAVADLPPGVTIQLPAADVAVVARAIVPLRISAHDDLALCDIKLVVTRSDQPQIESILPIHVGPPRVEPRPDPMTADRPPEDRRTIDYCWDLQEMRLPAGTHLIVYATATDYRSQTAKSPPRRLSIVTPAELEERIAVRQGLVLNELARVLKLQRGNRSTVESLVIRSGQPGGLEAAEVDQLQAAELNQRQVGRNLTSRTDGVAMHLVTLLADLENNRLDNPDFRRRAESLLAEIDRLDRGPLPAVGRELVAAVKSAQLRLEAKNPATLDAATEAALRRSARQQDLVIASLESMLGLLRQWDDYRRFHRELLALLHDQEELARATADLGRRTLTKDPRDLGPKESADLAVLVARQLELARSMERIEQEMAQSIDGLRQSNPLAADTLTDAVDEARRLGVVASMRTAAGQIQGNRIGQADQAHRQIAQDLQEVLNILANRRGQELARLAKKLAVAEGELAGLRRRQEEIRRGMTQAAGRTDAARKAELERLARQQEELRAEAERLARRLERLLADEAGRTTGQAARQMGQAAGAAGQGQPAEAVRQADAAGKSLEEAARQLARRRLEAQAELAMEQVAQLQDAIRQLRAQQQGVIDETRRLDAIARQGSLSRAQMVSLHDLARLQQSLHNEAARWSQTMAGAGGFQYALSAAASEMARAAGLLDRRQTGDATQQAQQNALDRFDLVLKAVEPEKSGEQGATNGANTGDQGTPQPAGGVQSLAEIKLLKLLQEDINLRTQRLAEVIAEAAPTEQQQRDYTALADQQRQLAELVYRLLRPEPKEFDPANPKIPEETP